MDFYWIIIIVLAVIIIWLIGTYNTLVRLRQRVKEAFADIDVQLKRRYDLIPNLISTVQGYAKHEKGVLENVTKARTQAMSAQGTQERAKAENMLTETLKSLFAVAENYPDLKASQNFLQLQDELSDTENKIQAARRFYNTQVRDLNTKLETFPTNTIAGMFKFTKTDYFEIETEAERAVPEVNFDQK
jgi:LemA protein